MTTKQNDAALTDEQLEGVAGGAVFVKVDGLNGGLRSSTSVGNPAPKPSNLKKGLASSPLGFQGNYVGVINPDSM